MASAEKRALRGTYNDIEQLSEDILAHAETSYAPPFSSRIKSGCFICTDFSNNASRDAESNPNSLSRHDCSIILRVDVNLYSSPFFALFSPRSGSKCVQ